ncbi:MAG TPA: carboxymuconolactone decarboxylase family protein [Methanocorpusculum sp.]|nr:carboxymuconolactone decarboxylase family protein [Methanocorpusculum sp.]
MTEKTHTCGCHSGTGDMKELEKNIGHVPVFFRDLAESDPGMHEAVLKLDNYIWADGALSRKQKKLMAIAIAAAMRDDHALHAQMQGAKKLGVTIEEVDEALRVAFMLAGMPSYVYGKTEAAEIFK